MEKAKAKTDKERWDLQYFMSFQKWTSDNFFSVTNVHLNVFWSITVSIYLRKMLLFYIFIWMKNKSISVTTLPNNVSFNSLEKIINKKAVPFCKIIWKRYKSLNERQVIKPIGLVKKSCHVIRLFQNTLFQ